MFRRPYLKITGLSGEELVSGLGSDFVGVKITDRADGEADELLIRIRRNKPYRQPPAVKTPFTVLAGWEDARGAAVQTGTYLFQRYQVTGEPEAGEELGLICQAADYGEKVRRVDSEYFDGETGHATYGDVLRSLAEQAGLDAAIDPKIASIPLAGGYLLRWKQSVIGLATEIGDELGAIVKPQAGRLTVRTIGSFQSPSGGALPAIVIPKDPNYAYQADVTPDGSYSQVSASWFDAPKGRGADAVQSLAGRLARIALPHLAGSEAVATATAAAAAQRLQAEEANAVFQSAGIPHAVAGAQVLPAGFGPGIDDIKWEALTVEHDIEPNGKGWITTVETRNAGY